jgi:hypothetical protein
MVIPADAGLPLTKEVRKIIGVEHRINSISSQKYQLPQYGVTRQIDQRHGLS